MNHSDYLGYGLGLRTDHYQTLLHDQPPIDWLEILTENYLVPGGKPLQMLDRICALYPVVMHGVSLSIGSTMPLDFAYLKQVKQLAQRTGAHWISDHLCWTAHQGINSHDLLPLPYTEEAVLHVADRVLQVQDVLGRRILLENVSSYITYCDSAMTEWEYLSAVAERADCLILLDINNIHVSAFNHGFDALDYLHGVPVERVRQFHLAGHTHCGTHIIDTHDADISDPVWELYVQAVRRFGRVSTMIERDDHIPPLEALLKELAYAKSLAEPELASAVA